MRKGKWINVIRQSVLNMNQTDFSRWLTERTGIPISSQMVARMENWGATDTNKKIEPPKEVIKLLEQGLETELGSEILAVDKRKPISTVIKIGNNSFEKETNVVPILYGCTAEFSFGKLFEFINQIQDPITVEVLVRSRQRQTPISDAVVFANFESNCCVKGVSDSNGQTLLRFPPKYSTSIKLKSIVVEAISSGHWDYYQLDTTLAINQPNIIELEEVSIPDPNNILTHFYTSCNPVTKETLPKVGVIDTGIDQSNPNLNVTKGCAFFTDRGVKSPPGNYGENGSSHGTHIAGIIGSSNTNCLGIYPNANLLSYRVYKDCSPGEIADKICADDVVEAIKRAIKDECDVINISLTFNKPTKDLRKACQEAYNKGSIIVAAAGNEANNAVLYPAKFETTISVSAMGRKKTIPKNSLCDSLLGFPQSKSDSSNKFATFSNYGKNQNDIQFLAPGVGIISTVDNQCFGVTSGTSQACAIISGIATRLLCSNPKIIAMERSINRSIAIINLLNSYIKDMGFNSLYQGYGMPTV